MDSLSIDNIQASYGKKEVLRGVSISIKKGEIATLIGPNGAGKSTLLKVIAGFLSPTIGKIWINEKEITYLPPHERVRLGISYFMQGGKVFPNLTVWENLEMGCSLLPLRNRRERIVEIIDFFPNLKNLISQRAGLLSGGERQALALAMVLTKRPEILLLDEPSAGLSPKLVQDILIKIKQINKTWLTSVLLVEQNVREALNIAQRAMVMVNGEVALETESPADWLIGTDLEVIFLGGKYKDN